MKWLVLSTVVCLSAVVSGCGPSAQDRARSQLGVLVRQEFNAKNFPAGGNMGVKDPWGNEITWSMTTKWKSSVTVRSNGADGLPYTRDDLTDTASIQAPPEVLDRARSQLGVLVRQEFNDKNFPAGNEKNLSAGNEKNFPAGGNMGVKDPWGSEITWTLGTSWGSYVLTVRSNGPDTLPYTYDDLTEKATFKIPVDPNAETASERFMRGLTRGAIKGTRQGFKAPLDEKREEKSPSKDKK